MYITWAMEGGGGVAGAGVGRRRMRYLLENNNIPLTPIKRHSIYSNYDYSVHSYF